jgi:hypothetical protein
MVKKPQVDHNWRIWDNKRNQFNVANTRLSAESSDAEDTGTPNAIDLVSNGFKIRTVRVNLMLLEKHISTWLLQKTHLLLLLLYRLQHVSTY